MPSMGSAISFLDPHFLPDEFKLQGEVCHILFLDSVEYTQSIEIADSPPAGTTELPTCPVCLGKISYLSYTHYAGRQLCL